MTILQDMLPAVTKLANSIDWITVIKTAALICAAVCILGGVLRLIFGKGSSLVCSVFACLSLALLYLAGIVIYVFIPQLRSSMTSLPFISVSGDGFYLWDIANLSTESLYPALLRLFILAFLVNLIESILPSGKKLLSWYGLRMLTVAASLGIYVGLSAVINSFAPQIYGEWAGYILIGLWLCIGLIGIVKVLVGIVLMTIHPVLGALFTFFFSNLFGKQLTKAILTSVLAICILMILYQLGFLGFAFSGFSFASYAPTCLIALAALYLFGKLL